MKTFAPWVALPIVLMMALSAPVYATTTSEPPPMPTTIPTSASERPLEPPDVAALRADPDVGNLVGWILDHPDDVSIVVSSDGEPPQLAWNADSVRPIASTFKTIVLAAYAREVVAGRLDPDEIVPPGEIERWLIDGTDGGSHAAMIETFGTKAGVRLDDLAAAMMAFSTNSATDVLLERVGRSAVTETVEALGLPDLAVSAAPPAGGVGLLSDETLGATVTERLDALATLSHEAVDEAAWRRSMEVAVDPDAAKGETLAALGQLTTWDAQLRFARTLPWRAQPRDMHDLLVRLLVEQRLGDAASDIILTHMSWPLQDPDLKVLFERLAAKEGELPGTLVAYGLGRPAAGAAAGTDRVAVLGLQEMDLETWMAVRESQEYQVLALRLLQDPDFATALVTALDQ